MNKENFKIVTKQVVEQLEGGYYSPEMLKDGRVKDTRYSNSGETMFGIDRKAGGALNTSEAGKKFWAIIDNANARKTWKWNYMGGDLHDKLLDLVPDILFPHYQNLSSKYLSPEAAKLVESDNRLLFHFVYSTWNGAGWFQKFANKFNTAVASGEKNIEKLIQVAINSRVNSGNSLIAQGGNKISKFFGTGIVSAKKSNKKRNTIIIIVIVIVVVGGFFAWKYREPLKVGFKKIFKK